jgi:hypothetical protein
MKNCAGGGAIYGFGLIGAAIYFLQHAHTLMQGVIAIVYAIFWPALILYKVLSLLKF